MSIKPKKRKELTHQEEAEASSAPKNKIDLATASGIFFILLYAFGVYTNLLVANYFMAAIWLILIFVNIFFIVRKRRWK